MKILLVCTFVAIGLGWLISLALCAAAAATERSRADLDPDFQAWEHELERNTA